VSLGTVIVIAFVLYALAGFAWLALGRKR